MDGHRWYLNEVAPPTSLANWPFENQDFNLEFLPKVRPLFATTVAIAGNAVKKKLRFPRNASKRPTLPPWLRAGPSKLSRYFGRCSVLQRDRARDPNSAREEDACNERQPLLQPSVSPLNCRGWSKVELKSRWLHTRSAGEFFGWSCSWIGRRGSDKGGESFWKERGAGLVLHGLILVIG